MLYEGALWIALGFAIAGLLHEFLPRGWVARRLGGERASAAIWGAVLGAPIPLCSCGVLPAAAGLRRAGASRSSLGAFLVSTPETGMDSIALSYALLGPLMAWVRPVVAVVSGITAGCVGLLFRDPDPASNELSGRHAHVEADGAFSDSPAAPDPLTVRVRRALRFGFGTLLDEIAFWLVVGLVTTGVLAQFLPDGFFQEVLGWDGGVGPMLAMAVVGLPLYICASASTPVAAALIAKGLSPGAALVFLLVGPATNAATLSVGRQILGTSRVLACIGSVVAGAMVAGMWIDAWAADAVRAAVRAGGPAGEWAPWVVLKAAAAVAIGALLLRSVWRTRFREGRTELYAQVTTWLAWQRSPRVRGATLAGLVAIAVFTAYLYGTAQARPKAAAATTKPRVVASIEPLAMLLREVAGARIAVATLLPPGASPHLFEPRVSDARGLVGARLYFEVGHPFDAWGSALLKGLDPAPRRLALLAIEGIEPLRAQADHDHGPVARTGQEGLDPHVWLDPIRVRDVVVPALVAALTELDPSGASEYQERAARFAADLGELDAELRAALEGQRTHFVALHPAWNYFATRYGLDPIEAIEFVAGEAPSPRRLAMLTREARARGAAALLVEPQLPLDTAQVLAGELGAPIVILDPIGDARDPERGRYAALLRRNAASLLRASGVAP